MRVPFYDLRAQYLSLKEELDAAIARVCQRGEFQLGEDCFRLEEEFARHIGTRHAVTVGSGTAALQLALLAVGVGPGDEVITVPNSDIGTTIAISRTGAGIKMVDIEPHLFTMDPAKIEAAITPRTRALLPVHLYGHPADMDPIMAIARRHDLLVVEDACLAHAARYKGRRVGTFGHAAGFSFASRKPLGALGHGGVIVTDDAGVAERIRLLRNYGAPEGFTEAKRHRGIYSYSEFPVEGHVSRMDSIQAATVRVKLPHLERWVARRRAIVEAYRRGFGDLPVTFPREPAGVESVYRGVTLRVANRDRVQELLAEQGISSGLHYVPPMHLQPAYGHLGYKKGDFPVTEACADDLLCLPVYPEMTDEQVGWVIEAMRAAVPAAARAAVSR